MRKYVRFDSEKNVLCDPDYPPGRFADTDGNGVDTREIKDGMLLTIGWAPCRFEFITDPETQVHSFNPVWSEAEKAFVFSVETIESWAVYKRGTAVGVSFGPVNGVGHRKLWVFEYAGGQGDVIRPGNKLQTFRFPDTPSRQFLHELLVQAGAVRVLEEA